MRLAHVITRLIVGGAQENTVASVLGLRQFPEFDVSLISGPAIGAEGSLVPAMASAGCPVILVPDLVRPVHPFKDLGALLALTRLFRKTQPDVVHTHSGKAGILGRIAARWAKVPIIVHTIHGPSFGPFQGLLSNAVFSSAERLAGRVTTHFVAVSNAMIQQYLGAGIGCSAQYTRILSGFPLETFIRMPRNDHLRQSLGFGPKDFVVGKVARLTDLKGHEDLFHAFRLLIQRVPSSRLLLIGDGPWRKRLEALSHSLGLRDRVVFIGLVMPEQIPEFMNVLDALVHLSSREGLPRALPQALAAGKPIVAYDCDGAGEVCLPGKTGFLVTHGKIQEVGDRLAELAESSEMRGRFGQAGREFVRELFSVERMVGALRDLYLQLALEAGLLCDPHTLEKSRS
jgi:glycosyltransferase involved in cell wall biosynthesis